MMPDAEPTPFAYPDAHHVRIHGPRDYRRYKAYKPWLRDEFVFRFVFCLTREVWYPSGQNAYHVEHLKPRSRAPHLALDYENMVYSRGDCNSFKQNKWPILDPCRYAYGAHFRVNGDGTIEGLSVAGWRMIRFLRLDRDKLNKFRREKIYKTRTLWEWRHVPDMAANLKNELRYPSDLPRLNRRQPDSRRQNINVSHYERHRRGELRETY
jgi:hypothetical protein